MINTLSANFSTRFVSEALKVADSLCLGNQQNNQELPSLNSSSVPEQYVSYTHGR